MVHLFHVYNHYYNHYRLIWTISKHIIFYSLGPNFVQTLHIQKDPICMLRPSSPYQGLVDYGNSKITQYEHALKTCEAQ